MFSSRMPIEGSQTFIVSVSHISVFRLISPLHFDKVKTLAVPKCWIHLLRASMAPGTSASLLYSQGLHGASPYLFRTPPTSMPILAGVIWSGPLRSIAGGGPCEAPAPYLLSRPPPKSCGASGRGVLSVVVTIPVVSPACLSTSRAPAHGFSHWVRPVGLCQS